jgi:pterin-4a-carbinolamine dehydratase
MKVSNLLREYFERESYPDRRKSGLPPRIDENFSLPVTPVKSGWEKLTNPERIRRVYTFIDRATLIDFVSMLLSHEDDVQHHGMHVIDHDQVSVEIYTKDLNRVTKTDLDYARDVDELYKQATFQLSQSGGWSDPGI